MTSRRLFVFDTNVLVSAALLEDSVAQQALLHALAVGVIILSGETLAELTDVLQREKFDPYITRDEREDFLEALVLAAELVEVTETIVVSRDPKDDKFLELAVQASADGIVSGDQDLQVLNPFRGIPILGPREFLRWISERLEFAKNALQSAAWCAWQGRQRCKIRHDRGRVRTVRGAPIVRIAFGRCASPHAPDKSCGEAAVGCSPYPRKGVAQPLKCHHAVPGCIGNRRRVRA